MLLLVFGILLPFRTDFFVLQAAYWGVDSVIGSYKEDLWHSETGPLGTMLRFYDVAPSTDSNFSLSLMNNKIELVGSKDLYFNFDYGEFYITPFEYYTDYINSGYQYAPYQTLGAGNMLRFQNTGLDIIDKGSLIAQYTLTQLNGMFSDFTYLYIIQSVGDSGYYTVFNEGYSAGYNKGYNDGFADGESDGLVAGYNAGYSAGYNQGYNTGESSGYNAGYYDGESFGYNAGYNDGESDGLAAGYDNGYNDGYDYGFNNGFDLGYNDGYQTAVNDGSTQFGLTTLLSGLFVGLGSLLSIELLPNISIGMIIAVPVVFGIIAFILGKRGGGD